MREIKFRAWDKDRNEMIENAEQGHDFGQYLSFWYFIANPEDRFVLMQYTGLLDCNGKEIYEGDIIKFTWEAKIGEQTWGEEIFQDEVEIHPIVWALGGFILDGEEGYVHRHCHVSEMAGDEIEIIGNIYENKNLLSLTNQGAG